jgi:nicotinamide mononucleotide transporter
MLKFIRNEFKGWSLGEYAWLLFCEAAIIGLSIFWGEKTLGLIAGATGVAYTVLAGKGKISCYIFGIINTPLYAFLSFQAKYYGDTLLNIYYFAMMFAGIFAWRKNIDEIKSNEIVKTRLSARERFYWTLSIALFTMMLWGILLFLGGRRPLCDAMTNTLSVAAMILTVKRCMEQWLMWIAVNLIEVFMWWKVYNADGNSISILLMWFVFLLNGIFFFIRWKKDARKNSNPCERTLYRN